MAIVNIPTIEYYPDWLHDECDIDIELSQTRYINSTNLMKEQFENSKIWKAICSNLSTYNQRYLLLTGYDLLQNVNKPPVIQIKEFDKTLNKSYRKNFILNKQLPDPPDGDWVTPENWYVRIDDIIRTLIVVKYLDGVRYITEIIDKLCKANRCKCFCDFEAREEGYYAAHISVQQKFEIPAIFDTRTISASVEIQVTTQIQEVIRTLLHKYYEKRRVELTPQSNGDWRWDYMSSEFATNYLGHVLHYVYHIVIGIRDKED